MTQTYDALLILSFGGPEGMADVMPFLENVLRGRNVPRERMIEVSHHYEMFGGVSPINNQNRALIAALREAMPGHNIHLPIYWGNRNWHPMLADTLEQMKADGIRRAITFVTSAYSSYSGCRQYREDIAKAQEATGEGAPQFDKLRVYYNHPGFIQANADCLRAALDKIPLERRANTRVAFTAHSIPVSMATNCAYEAQLLETCRLVAEAVGHPHWQLVYQSRSGQASQAWLEPDICDYLRTSRNEGVTDAVIAPVGFISDHMEVLFDLDTEALEVSREINLNMVRAATVGTHPAFVDMICELITERMTDNAARRFIGIRGANHDVCPVDCCLPAVRPATSTGARPALNVVSGD